MKTGKHNIAIAIGAHPDDIEFMMAGTLLLLRRVGWETHYLNLSRGDCGSLVHDRRTLTRLRRQEAKSAAKLLDAHYHESFCSDMEILYDLPKLRRLAAILRDVKPTIVLTHSPLDYMDDHTNTCRLAVSAAFARCLPNFRTTPPRPHHLTEVTVYHSMPHGLCEPLRTPIVPHLYVNTTAVQAQKLAALAEHRSQHGWLDASQKMSSYLRTMEDFARKLGRQSGKFRVAEGWRRHLHFGFCAENADPLRDALGRDALVNRKAERGLANRFQ
jgi:LmbE family N-acetylglucosaminyl deacetylase